MGGQTSGQVEQTYRNKCIADQTHETRSKEWGIKRRKKCQVMRKRDMKRNMKKIQHGKNDKTNSSAADTMTERQLFS